MILYVNTLNELCGTKDATMEDLKVLGFLVVPPE